MAKPTSEERFYDIEARGKFGNPTKYGKRIYGKVKYGEEEKMIIGPDDEPQPRWGIYRRYHSHWKLVDGKRKYFGPWKFSRRIFYIPKEPGTPDQVVNWNKFKEGMVEWKNLTEEIKDWYNKRARKLRLYGVNLFLSEWLNSN